MKRINKMVLAVIMLSVIGYQGSGYSATVGGGSTMKKGDLSDLIGGADTNTSEVVIKSCLTATERAVFGMCCDAANCEISFMDLYNDCRISSCDCSKNKNGDKTGRDDTTVYALEEYAKACFEDNT